MSGKVAMIESGVRGFANAVKRLAVKDKKFAEELVFMHGIRSEITPNALKGITKDMFSRSGKLTQEGKKEVVRLIKELNLPKNATWDEALAAAKASKEKVKQLIPLTKLPELKFKNFNKKINEINKTLLDKFPKEQKISKMNLDEYLKKF